MYSSIDVCVFISQADSMCYVHYIDVIMSAMASQLTGVSIVYLTVCSGADQRKHQSSESLAFVRGIHRWPVDSPHKRPITRKMFPFDDVIMWREYVTCMDVKTWKHLTHWGRDKMDAISQTTFSNTFSWMKMFEFWLNFHWSLQGSN